MGRQVRQVPEGRSPAAAAVAAVEGCRLRAHRGRRSLLRRSLQRRDQRVQRGSRRREVAAFAAEQPAAAAG